MSILHTSCRCPMLAVRLRAAQAAQSRALSSSALACSANPLPTTNWGSAPAKPAKAKPVVRATNWGAPPAKPAALPATSWGAPPARRDDGGSRQRGGDGFDRPRQQRRRRDDDGVVDGGYGGGNRQRNRGGNRNWEDRDDSGPNRERRERGGFGVSRGGDNQRGDRNGGFGMNSGGERGDRKPLPSNNWGGSSGGPSRRREEGGGDAPARGRAKSEEDVAPARGRTKFADVAPAVDLADIDEGDDRHARRRKGTDGSRSLLHSHEEEAELPEAHHHGKKKKKGERFNKRDWVRDEENDIELQEQESMRRMQEAKAARDRAKAAEKAKAAAKAAREAIEKDIYIPANISVAQLADKFGVKLVRLQRKMVQLGFDEDVRRSDYRLSSDDACSLALEYNFNPIIDSERGFDIYPEPEVDASQCPLRPPVVTIMGHVDHGKTTLLDALRHTSVAAGEAGGITQHIGAFSVPLAALQKGADPDATITFLDTPGHAAFTGMRSRGASVTDLVVLVVAADDGVMPQTKEVIELVQREGDNVGLVVAINKCDKPQIDVDKVKAGLGAHGIILEEDGGDVPSVRVSGLAKLGLDDLVETLATLAEVRDLRARQDGKAEGWVLESNVDKGRGVVATVLVTRGKLKIGDAVVAGTTWCHVRTMTDSAGNPVTEAGPGMPVTVTGWRDVPVAGDQLLQAENEGKAKKCVDNRLRDVERKAMAADAEVINIRRQEDRQRLEAERTEMELAKEAGLNVQQALLSARRAADEAGDTGRKELRLVIKADVSGTVEAVVGSLASIGNGEAGVKIVHTGVGEVTESDVMLGDAAEGTVIGFNVECPRNISSMAADAGVPVLTDSVIYRLIENVRTRVAALLPPRIETRVTGEATVSQIFPIKSGRKILKNIAGCKVMNGTIAKADKVRVLREQGGERQVIFEGSMDTLKHVKKDVTEMRKGTECGVAIEGFDDYQTGDQIVTFQTFEVARTLD